MEKQAFLDRASALKTEKQALLNDTFLWVKLAKEAVEQLPDTKFDFEVPKARKPEQTRRVQRNDAQVVKKRMLTKDIINSAFISAVAAVEDYLSKIIVDILHFDNNRIMCTISGVKFSKDVSVVDVITKDREQLIDQIVNERVHSLFYASPQKQLEYFEEALEIVVDQDIWEMWIEIKARRDLWVHNAGVVNQIYLEKVTGTKSFELGEEAIIDEEYFSGCIGTLKTMIGRINRDIRNAYR